MLKIILVIIINTSLVYTISYSRCADPVVVNEVVFQKLGTYRGLTSEGSEYQKSYFVTRYAKGSFTEARGFCHSYGLEFLSMETLEEARAIFTMADNNSILKSFSSIWIIIDGATLTAKSTTDWYWTNSGKKIAFTMPWIPGTPNENDSYCLSFGRYLTTGKFAFDDGGCNNNGGLIGCHRVDFLLP